MLQKKYSMNEGVVLELVKATETAALSAARVRFLGNPDTADMAAVTGIRLAFQTIRVQGTVTISEGVRHDTPLLYVGEQLGCGEIGDPKIDIAVDPLNGSEACSLGYPDSFTAMVISDRGESICLPDIYMKKIAVGPKAFGTIDLKVSIRENLRRIAITKDTYIEDLTAIVLDRRRHVRLIHEIRNAGAKVKLVRESDINAALLTCIDNSGVDVLFGIGGAPEGVLAATAIRSIGGDFLGQLVIKNPEDIEKCRAFGIKDLRQIFTIEDLVKENATFIATGVTTGELLKGVQFYFKGAKTSSIIMESRSGTIRFIDTDHHFNHRFKLEHMIRK